MSIADAVDYNAPPYVRPPASSRVRPAPVKVTAELVAKMRAVNEPSADALGSHDEPIHRAVAAFTRARATATPHTLEARHGAAWDQVYAEALAELDSLVERLRPALVESRARAAALAAELAEAERAAAEAAEAERRRLELDEAVRAGVGEVEARRLAAIEAKVRSRLAGAGDEGAG